MVDLESVVLDERAILLKFWLEKELNLSLDSLIPLKGDASFRRYFVVIIDGQSFIAMDAPPKLEPVASFVAIAKGLFAQGLCTPVIHYEDQQRGFLLLSDFGRRVYCQELTMQTADHLYGNALYDLLAMQELTHIDGMDLPVFDRAEYLFELNNFRQWYLEKHCGLTLTQAEQEMLNELFDNLIDTALAQPQVFTHRDYHSRNLMILESGRAGILDFQDALWAPITYDLVSLLRDCYIDWPAEKVVYWVRNFYQQLQAKGAVVIGFAEFLRWFDWMGLQRHLKAIFIFARKYLRDQNDAYLNDIPRAMGYVRAVIARYPEFKEFQHFMDLRVCK